MITSALEFVRLRKSDDPREYRRAAHEEAPLEVWREIFERHPEMRFWVAHNKTVPVEMLVLLSEDADERVRDMVARKRKLPERLQLNLAEDASQDVRLALAYNAKATRVTLRRLASDEAEDVRKRARNRLEVGDFS